MIKKFEEFIFCNELDKNLCDNLSENKMTQLKDYIQNYLDKIYDSGKISTNLKNIFSFFRKNKIALGIIMGLLIYKYNLSKNEIMNAAKESHILTAEEIYNNSIQKNEKEKSILGNNKEFLNKIAERESNQDAEKINTLGYLGKYQFGEIALKDILKRESGESDEEYEKRMSQFWPDNFGVIRNSKDFNYFKSKFKKYGVKFWPEKKQDKAMQQLLKNNKKYLGDYIEEWVGKKKNGIEITLSGLLAGAHLLGPSKVKKFLDKGKITRDAYGTEITEYIKKFSGYNIKI